MSTENSAQVDKAPPNQTLKRNSWKHLQRKQSGIRNLSQNNSRIIIKKKTNVKHKIKFKILHKEKKIVVAFLVKRIH